MAKKLTLSISISIFAAGCSDPDPLGAPETTADPVVIDVAANSVGRLTSSGNSDARRAYQYDGLGRVVAAEDDLEGNRYVFRTSFGYSQGARPGPGNVALAETLASGEVIRYAYDASGAQEAIRTQLPGRGEEQIVSSIRRNARGQTTEVRYGDNTVSRRTYRDAIDLRLESLETTGPSGVIQRYGYRFDPSGNVAEISDACDEAQTGICCTTSQSCLPGAYSATYDYDSLHQLTSMTTPAGGTSAYHYDAAGNLTNHAGVGQAYGARTESGRRIAHAPSSSGGESFSYDDNGNLIASSDGLAITWNGENMATLVARGGRALTEKWFVGEAAWKKVEDGLTTHYLPSMRVEQSGTDRRLRTYYETFAERDTDGSLKFYHGDHLGSSTLVTDAGGAVIHRASYQPYGADRQVAGSFTPKLQFNFEEKDASGFYDYGARLYDPRTGRWLSPDDRLTDGLNRYAYVSNNPLRYSDPTGHQQQEQDTSLLWLRGDMSPEAQQWAFEAEQQRKFIEDLNTLAKFIDGAFTYSGVKLALGLNPTTSIPAAAIESMQTGDKSGVGLAVLFGGKGWLGKLGPASRSAAQALSAMRLMRLAGTEQRIGPWALKLVGTITRFKADASFADGKLTVTISNIAGKFGKAGETPFIQQTQEGAIELAREIAKRTGKPVELHLRHRAVINEKLIDGIKQLGGTEDSVVKTLWYMPVMSVLPR